MEEKHLTRAILIGADTGEYDAESSMDELSELAKTAGAEEIARVLQKREAYEPATVIGGASYIRLRAYRVADTKR